MHVRIVSGLLKKYTTGLLPRKDITKENLYEYLNGKKNVPDAPEKIVFTKRKLNQYFPKYMSTPERERIIISLLEKWKEQQDNKN